MDMEEFKFHSSVANTFLSVFKQISPLKKATIQKLFRRRLKN
jgi:hypothetical protein